MLYLGFLKRIIPFVLTFAAGLFLASFFVAITPSFRSREGKDWRRHERSSKWQELRELREENARLKSEIEALRSRSKWEDVELQFDAPLSDEIKMVPLEVPPPPARPAKVRPRAH